MSEQIDDRRATLEASFNAAEEGLNLNEAVERVTAETITPEQAETAPKNDAAEDVKITSEDPKTTSTDEPTPTKTKSSEAPQSQEEKAEKPPQAWKAAQKAKWDKLDPDIRQEVLRRERETTQVLSDTAQARQFVGQFQSTIQPYMARIQATGANPLQAVQNLLAADHLLSTAPAPQKAAYLAKLIQEYGVDIRELDAALVGKVQADPVETRVEQLLQQRLQPFQQYLTQQQHAAIQQQQAQNAKIETTIEEMAQDNITYPHFEAVRAEMADAIEIFSKRGVYLSLPEAYNKAIAMNPTLSQVAAQAAATQAQRAQAASANARAQRALSSSVSVGGAPSGSIGARVNAGDRRAAISAAFEAAAGR